MKKILLLGLLIFAAQFSSNAQEIRLKNTTGHFFAAATPSTSTHNCSSTVYTDSYYYDSPPNSDQLYSTISLNHIAGLAFEYFPGGPTIFLPFCGTTSGGKSYSVPGYGPLQVHWEFDYPSNQLIIWFY